MHDSVTSLAYHPNKNLMVCSIFGDLINSSLFVLTNAMDTTEQSVQHPFDDAHGFYKLNDNLNQSYHALDQWQRNHEDEFIAATDDGIKSNAIDSILNRIDDLFCMAIRSPKNNDSNDFGGSMDQIKEVQEFLEKIHIESTQSKAAQNRPNDTENHDSNGPSCQSSDFSRPDSKGYRMLSASKQNACASWQLQSTTNASRAHSDDDSPSDASHHTFSVEPPARNQNEIVVGRKSDEYELSNATFSIQSVSASNNSNRTFEITQHGK